jgi:hypothetical protein
MICYGELATQLYTFGSLQAYEGQVTERFMGELKMVYTHQGVRDGTSDHNLSLKLLFKHCMCTLFCWLCNGMLSAVPSKEACWPEVFAIFERKKEEIVVVLTLSGNNDGSFNGNSSSRTSSYQRGSSKGSGRRWMSKGKKLMKMRT